MNANTVRTVADFVDSLEGDMVSYGVSLDRPIFAHVEGSPVVITQVFAEKTRPDDEDVDWVLQVEFP